MAEVLKSIANLLCIFFNAQGGKKYTEAGRCDGYVGPVYKSLPSAP